MGGNDEHVHRPPIFGNTVVVGGRFMQLNRRAFPPSDATPVVLRNGIANGLRRRPIALGPRTWSGIRGELSLTPTVYAGLGELSDLVVFEWHDAAGEHAVGVNVWEPLIDSVATLRAIVATLAPQSPSAPPRTVAVVDGVAMIASPPWLDRLCRTPRILRGACPSRVPAVGSQGASVEIVPTPPSAPPTLKSLFVSVSWGGEYPDPRLNQPPGFVHLDLTAGHVVRSRRFAPLLPLARVTAPTGYEAKRPISLGDAYGPRIRARLSSATASGTTSATAGRQTGVITRSTSTPGCRLDRPRTR